MRGLVGKRLPGTHAVKILLGATLLAGVAAVLAARSPSDTAGRQKVAEAAVQAQSTTAGNTPGSTATQGQTPVTNSEGAVPEPAEEQLPGSDIVSSASNSRFSMPLKQWSKVTDRYGAKNRGPGLIHGGIDLALEGLSHSNVYAACTGTVSDASYNGTYGNHIFVDCGDGCSTLYGHLSQMNAKVGDAVSPDVVIGISGSTGFSTGEHLHFEIRWLDTPVNPEDYLEFHIPPGTPLSDGPLWFPSSGGTGAAAASTPSGPPPTATNKPTPTDTPTIPPTPTITPTPTWTPPPTATLRPPPKTPKPNPVAR